MIEQLTQFGVAGLMGALWLWERSHSRLREQQLTAAHRKIVETDRELDVLVRLVAQNTRALSAFEKAQQRTCELLENISHELFKKQPA